VVEAAPGTELGVKPGTDFYALGLHGQYIYVAPEQQMVIVRLGREAGRMGWWPPLLRKIAAMNPLP
jgi:CubicO group peptidase (beta-lactamase class C family)